MRKFSLMMSDLKADPRNNPRILQIVLQLILRWITSVQKGVFTYCKFRENEKCPPWELRAKKLNIIIVEKQYL